MAVTQLGDAVVRMSCGSEIVRTLPEKLATTPLALANVVACRVPDAALIKPDSELIVSPANIGEAVV